MWRDEVKMGSNEKVNVPIKMRTQLSSKCYQVWACVCVCVCLYQCLSLLCHYILPLFHLWKIDKGRKLMNIVSKITRKMTLLARINTDLILILSCGNFISLYAF